MENADKLRRKKHNFLWGKMISLVFTANSQVCFTGSACLVQGHPDLRRLDRSLKEFYLYKQSGLSWRNINQHWAVRVKSYFFTSKYSFFLQAWLLYYMGSSAPKRAQRYKHRFSPAALWISMDLSLVKLALRAKGGVGFQINYFFC